MVKVLPEKNWLHSLRRSRRGCLFHFSKVQKVGTLDLQEGEEVEYEIDELHRIEKVRLQATLVRRSVRPLTLRLAPSDAPDLKAHHHPKARRLPDMRDKSSEGEEQNTEEPGEAT
ncbi:MAG: hypothetical protein R3C56_31735 [Pirellulaceae bacterium]